MYYPAAGWRFRKRRLCVTHTPPDQSGLAGHEI